MSPTFHRLTRPSLILASPYDVQYLRDLTKRLHGRFISNQAEPDTVALFAWEEETKTVPFDDRLPAQAQLPSPRDPFCRGVIAFFGEWMGRDLHAGYDKSQLAGLGAEDERQPFRLVHPWRNGAEDSGGFPLTGSTFEVLATIAALAELGQTRAPPLLLLFVGPPDVASEPLAAKAQWGNARLRDALANALKNAVAHYDGSTINSKDVTRTMTDMCAKLENIESHLKMLRNFYCYLNTVRAHVSKIVANEAAATKAINWFLHDVVGKSRRNVEADDVFKGLGFYDVKDSSIYFGRETAVRAALARIEALWQEKKAVHLHWVRGQSGSGKSSFLRAGLIGRMRRASYSEADCVSIVVRPNQLDVGGAAHQRDERCWPLRRLFRHCMAAIRDVGVDDAQAADDLTAFDAADDPATWAVDALRHELEAADGGIGRRLVLGLDQFEEIVDLLEDTRRRPTAHELISFVLRLAQLQAVMVIATMRDDRAHLLRHHAALEANYRATKGAAEPLGIPTGEDMATIIRTAFSYVDDLVLEPNLIEQLVDRVREFSKSENGTTTDSCLPLIGVTLERLYLEVAKPLIADYRNFGDHRDAADGTGSAIGDRTGVVERAAKPDAENRNGAYLTIAVAENYQGSNYLDVEGAIKDLAGQAVEMTKAETGPNWDDLEIANVLRRLVSWAGTSGREFSLPAVPWPKPDVARRLTAAMKQRRLIVDDEGRRIRLVHEAILRNWPVAQEWLEFELPLLQDVPVLRAFARKWQQHRPREHIVELPSFFREPALRLLALWFDVFDEADPANDAEDNLLLRDFCLEILSVHGRAADVVEQTRRLTTHFMLAVAYGQVELVRRMLADDRTLVNRARDDGRTPIFFPAFQNHVEMLDLLLAHGAQADVADEKGWRPIHAAATRGSLDAGRQLVSAGARLDGEGAPSGMTPLRLAAGGAHVDFIRYLVSDCGVDIEAVGEDGQTAVFSALADHRVSALDTLLAFGARTGRTVHEGTDQDFGWTLLHLAANQGLAEAVEVLLEQGFDSSLTLANGFTALHLAAQEGHADVVRMLCSRTAAVGARVDLPALELWLTAARIAQLIGERKTTEPHKSNAACDMTPLHLAVKNHRLDAVRVLLDYSDLDAVTGAGATSLHLAAANGRDEMARLLMGARPDTRRRDAWGRTALLTAISAGNWSVARVLIERGVALDQCAWESFDQPGLELTPLQWAAANGNRQAVQFCLRHAGHSTDIVNQPDPFGRRPLHFAAIAGAAEVVRLLLDEAADVLALDDHGASAIHYAARNGHSSALEALLRNRPDPGGASVPGVPTPLHMAAYGGRTHAVAQLLDAGWMNDVADAQGLSAFHRAVQAGSLGSVRALAAAGARIAAPTCDERFTALNFAAEAGAEDVLAWLLDSEGVVPDLTAPAGERPLLTAMRYHRYGAASLLLDAGACSDVADPAGCSLLGGYERQVVSGGALRHDGFEAALKRAGFVLPASFAKDSTDVAPPPPRPPPPRIEVDARIGSGPESAGFFVKDLSGAPGDVWHQVTGGTLSAVLKSVAPVDGKWSVMPETTSISWRKLPWYDDVALLRLRNAEFDVQNIGIFFLSRQGALSRLDGTSAALHRMNADAPIRLTAHNVLDYLRFFCYFVHGDEGPFYIAEDPADPLLPQWHDHAAQAVIQRMLRKATLDGPDDQGRYRCDATVWYSSALIAARFSVSRDGVIAMESEEPIAGNLSRHFSRRLR